MKLRSKRDKFNVWDGGKMKQFEHNDALIMKGGKINDDAQKYRDRIAAERKALGLE